MTEILKNNHFSKNRRWKVKSIHMISFQLDCKIFDWSLSNERNDYVFIFISFRFHFISFSLKQNLPGTRKQVIIRSNISVSIPHATHTFFGLE